MSDVETPAVAAIHRPRSERLLYVMATIVVLFSVLATLSFYYARSADQRSAHDRNDKQAAVQALGTANSSLSKAGLPPVPTPSAAEPVPTVTVTVPGRAGVTGAAGPGPSTTQIQIAVDSYCAAIRCGTGPSAAQVAQAVATYCGSDGKCRGATGSTGLPGQTGASGAPGASVTADQVANAVSTYCGAHANCQGAPGSAGTDGKNGTNGVDGAAGQPPVSWTYTDALGISHTCTRTNPFDPTAPTYTCS